MPLEFPQYAVTRFCALARSRTGHQQLEDVFICLIELNRLRWRILIDSGWREVTEKDDQDYIDELIEDMKFRVMDGPEALFEQLSNLSVGPLLTYAVGHSLDPQILARVCDFIEV